MSDFIKIKCPHCGEEIEKVNYSIEEIDFGEIRCDGKNLDWESTNDRTSYWKSLIVSCPICDEDLAIGSDAVDALFGIKG